MIVPIGKKINKKDVEVVGNGQDKNEYPHFYGNGFDHRNHSRNFVPEAELKYRVTDVE